MSDMQKEIPHQYWKPVQLDDASPDAPAVYFCTNCGSRLADGAHFCHVCGNGRDSIAPTRALIWLGHIFDVRKLQLKSGLTPMSFALFVCGLGCAVGAILTGFLNKAATLVQWQAVQVWRMEWLLGTIAALLGAELFQRRSSPPPEE